MIQLLKPKSSGFFEQFVEAAIEMEGDDSIGGADEAAADEDGRDGGVAAEA